METIQHLVRTWIASSRDQQLDETVAAISAGEASLLDVVKALGEYLTAEEDDLRNKGVEFLSLVISRCPPERINRQSTKVLVKFMSDKLDDTDTIIPALKGLASLVTLPAFTSVEAIDVMKALFAHVKMKTLAQSQRFTVYTIIDSLVAKHREALKNMGAEFLDNYLVLAEGEKDPRNLLVAFAIARVILIEFDIKHHVEQLFNITFCYFPITFRPPPDDPYGITTEDLKKGLRDCLNATPLFGQLAISLFLEKLTAGSPATKRDTLQTLDVSLPVYGPFAARESAKKLWNMLKLEIFQPTDPETEAMALHTTQVLIRTIYSLPAENADKNVEMEGLAKDVCEECIKILKEPEKSQATPAMKVICAFVSTTPSVAKFTLEQTVPHLVKLFLDPGEVLNRAPVLRLLADLIIAVRDSSLKDDSQGKKEPALAAYKDEVLGVLTVGLKNTASCGHALDGLKGIATTSGLLSDDELGFVVHNVNEVFTGENAEQADDVSDAILELLTAISSTAPKHVSQTTLPLLFSSLPDTAPPRTAEAERLKYWTTLSFLGRLCLQADLFETLVVRLSTKLDLICVPQNTSGSNAEEDHEPTGAYAHSILKTLADAFRKKVARGDPDVAKYIDRLVLRLFNLHIYSALVSEGDYLPATDPRLVSVSAEIITLVVQSTPTPKQEQFVKGLFSAFLEGKTQDVAQGQQRIPLDKPFGPLKSGAPALQKNCVLLFSAALVALQKEVPLPVAQESAFVEDMLKWSIFDADNTMQSEAAEHAIASALNKRVEGFEAFLNNKLEGQWLSQATDISLGLSTRRRVISAWAWMNKALQVRSHALAQPFTDRLVDLFDDVDIGWDAARAIGRIVDQDKVLTKKNHAVIRFLFAQKFANVMLPRLIEGAKTSSEPRRQNAYLVALTSLIKSIPKTAYVHQMPALMPLLLRGLDLPDHEIRANVIDTLLAVADTSSKDKNAIVAEHASSLVSTMLRNSVAREMPSVRVRTAALRYLAILPTLVRYDVLHPSKPTVLRELAKALDDPKRAVRKEAVEARTNWYKYTG